MTDITYFCGLFTVHVGLHDLVQYGLVRDSVAVIEAVIDALCCVYSMLPCQVKYHTPGSYCAIWSWVIV